MYELQANISTNKASSPFLGHNSLAQIVCNLSKKFTHSQSKHTRSTFLVCSCSKCNRFQYYLLELPFLPTRLLGSFLFFLFGSLLACFLSLLLLASVFPLLPVPRGILGLKAI